MQVLGGMKGRTRVAGVALWMAWSMAGCGGNDGKLKVTGLEPTSGDSMGGQIIVVQGQGFMKTARSAKIYFGDQPGNVIRFRNDGEMIVEAPGGKPDQTVDVLVVFEPGGEIPIPKGYTFREKKGLDVNDLNTK